MLYGDMSSNHQYYRLYNIYSMFAQTSSTMHGSTVHAKTGSSFVSGTMNDNAHVLLPTASGKVGRGDGVLAVQMQPYIPLAWELARHS